MRSKNTGEEKIQLLHPQGKNLSRIDKQKYEAMRQAILRALKSKSLTHDELHGALLKKLNGKFDGNIAWYMESVKLDLEARKLIERVNPKPQKYRIR